MNNGSLPYKVRINRNAPKSKYNFFDIFVDFDRVTAIKRIFGKRTNKILEDLVVKVYNKDWYMWVDEKKGALCVGRKWLKKGDARFLYLDVVHELVHIRQWQKGMDLFDEQYEYLERPTELEAYKIAADEAKRIGLNKKELAEYLQVEWVSEEQYEKFWKVLKL